MTDNPNYTKADPAPGKKTEVTAEGTGGPTSKEDQAAQTARVAQDAAGGAGGGETLTGLR